MLLDSGLVKHELNKEARWCLGHGASESYLGGGLLYYTLAYMLKAGLCICLGSGGGFVPRMMRQAQRDLEILGLIVNSRTILIDADISGWGRPDWTSPGSFFRTQFPEIEWVKMRTEEYTNDDPIDYLHIDADHSRALADFLVFKSRVLVGGIVTIHDTMTRCNAPVAVEKIREMPDWDIIDFQLWAGIAVAVRRK